MQYLIPVFKLFGYPGIWILATYKVAGVLQLGVDLAKDGDLITHVFGIFPSSLMFAIMPSLSLCGTFDRLLISLIITWYGSSVVKCSAVGTIWIVSITDSCISYHLSVTNLLLNL